MWWWACTNVPKWYHTPNKMEDSAVWQETFQGGSWSAYNLMLWKVFPTFAPVGLTGQAFNANTGIHSQTGLLNSNLWDVSGKKAADHRIIWKKQWAWKGACLQPSWPMVFRKPFGASWLSSPSHEWISSLLCEWFCKLVLNSVKGLVSRSQAPGFPLCPCKGHRPSSKLKRKGAFYPDPKISSHSLKKSHRRWSFFRGLEINKCLEEKCSIRTCERHAACKPAWKDLCLGFGIP